MQVAPNDEIVWLESITQRRKEAYRLNLPRSAQSRLRHSAAISLHRGPPSRVLTVGGVTVPMLQTFVQLAEHLRVQDATRMSTRLCASEPDPMNDLQNHDDNPGRREKDQHQYPHVGALSLKAERSCCYRD